MPFWVVHNTLHQGFPPFPHALSVSGVMCKTNNSNKTIGGAVRIFGVRLVVAEESLVLFIYGVLSVQFLAPLFIIIQNKFTNLLNAETNSRI